MTVGDDDRAQAVTGKRRWAIGEKRRIVEETFAPGTSVSVVARRHNVNANQVFSWRTQYRRGDLSETVSAGLMRIGMFDAGGVIRPVPVPPEPVMASPVMSRPSSGIIEIELIGGIKVRVDGDVDESHLRRVLAVIRSVA
jgi:transposase